MTLNKKQKILFRSSIFINFILALILVWGIVATNFSNDQLFYTEVQDNLVELEGLIGHQQRNNWSEENLVTQKLNEVMDGLYIALNNGKYTKTLSKSDREIYENLLSKLRQYPQDQQYEFTKLTQEDRENFVALRTKLRNVGLGLNLTNQTEFESFIDEIKALEESIEAPLYQ
jgi:hypothetical protein